MAANLNEIRFSKTLFLSFFLPLKRVFARKQFADIAVILMIMILFHRSQFVCIAIVIKFGRFHFLKSFICNYCFFFFFVCCVKLVLILIILFVLFSPPQLLLCPQPMQMRSFSCANVVLSILNRFNLVALNTREKAKQ